MLKLHGSANWTYCPKCEKLATLDKYITPLELESHRQLLHLPDCPTMTAFNVIVPPTWYKHNHLEPITRIWSRAIQEISLATHLFVIGYSFPRTDVFFEQLMTLGFTSNGNLKRVVVLNPDARVRESVKDFFDSHFLARSVVFRGIKFEDLMMVGPVQVSNEKELDGFIEGMRRFEEEPPEEKKTLGEITQEWMRRKR